MYKQLIIIMTLIFLNAAAQMITILGSLYMNKVGFSVSHIGVVLTFFGIGALLGGYLGGYLSDFVKHTKIIKLSLFVNSIFTILFPFINTFALLSACMFLVGLSNGVFRPASTIFLFDIHGINLSHSKLLSYRRISVNLGMAFGAPILGQMYEIDTQLPFLIMGVMLLISFALSYHLVEQRCFDRTNEKKLTTYNSNLKNFILINVLLVVTLMIFNQTQALYSVYLKDIVGLSVSNISLIFAISGIFIVFFQVPLIHLFDKLPPEISCLVGMIFISIGVGMTSGIATLWQAILLCVLWTAGEIVFFPIVLSYILKISKYSRGKTMGIYQVCFSLGGIISPLLGAAIYAYNPRFLWFICLCVGVMFSFIFIYIYAHRKLSQSISQNHIMEE